MVLVHTPDSWFNGLETLSKFKIQDMTMNLYLFTKFEQGRLSDFLTPLHFPRSFAIPMSMSFLGLSRVRAKSCEYF